MPEYLDPRDATNWRKAILDYAADSARRRDQLVRLAEWHAPRWNCHFEIVDRLLDELS